MPRCVVATNSVEPTVAIAANAVLCVAFASISHTSSGNRPTIPFMNSGAAAICALM